MRVNKSQLIEVKVFGIASGNTQTNIQFQDQPYLRNKKITGIETVYQTECPVTLTGAQTASNADAIKGFLTLYTNDILNPTSVGEWIQNVPLALLHKVQNQASDAFVRNPYLLIGQTIIWDKCFIRLTTALNNTTDVSFLFNVYFE